MRDFSASDIDKVILVGGSTRIPAVQEAIKKETGKEPHKGVNPDEVVAIGAAIQAGIISRRCERCRPARRNSAITWNRNDGRRVYEIDSTEYDDSDVANHKFSQRQRITRQRLISTFSKGNGQWLPTTKRSVVSS